MRKKCKLSLARNELQNLVAVHIPNREYGFEGMSCLEIAEKVNREPKHITQVLSKLVSLGSIQRSKEKQGVSRSKYIYYKTTNGTDQSKKKKKTCNNCQRLNGLGRCILLELVEENAPWALTGELLERSKANDLRGVNACNYHRLRVNGHIKNKTMNEFIRKNTDSDTYIFRCPIDRCNNIIEEFSYPYTFPNIGSNAFYCPHCGSPINFVYNSALDRYQVQYWDSQFDILQQYYEAITVLKLPSRY